MTERPAPYDSLLDEEIWDFIERSVAFYPPDAISLSIEAQRRVYDGLCRGFSPARPAGLAVCDLSIEAPHGSIPLREYRASSTPAAAWVLYLHGGGFLLGGLESHDSICAEICAGTGFGVVSVDYRLAPEHLHPAAFEDGLSAFRHLAAVSGRPVILCGDSAGGNLAAGVAWATREDEIRPAGQLLIYPALGADFSKGTFVSHANAPMLTTADMAYYDQVRSGGTPPLNDPRFVPLAATDYAGMPPTLVFTAECDPLAGDGPDFCARITGAGGKARCIEETGLVHGYLRARHSAECARQSFSRILAALTALGAGTWQS